MGSRSSDLGASPSQSHSLDSEKRTRITLTLLSPSTLARGTVRAAPALPLAAWRSLAQLTRHKIGHLSNGETVRLADVILGWFCYTIKCPPVQRGGLGSGGMPRYWGTQGRKLA